MSGLAELLIDPAKLARALLMKPVEPVALQKAVEKLVGKEGVRKVENVAALQARLRQAALTGTMQSVSKRDLTNGCRAFLDPPMPPGRDSEVRPKLISQVARMKRRSALLALLNVYLDRFDPMDQDIAELGRSLSQLSEQWPWRERDEWPSRAQTYALFNAAKAPARIGQEVMTNAGGIHQVLGRAGLETKGRRRGGLVEAAFVQACRSVPEGQGTIHLQLRLIEWAEPGPGKLAFPKEWPEFARALLSPWIHNAPPPEHQGVITSALIGYAGDPRIRRAIWANVEHVALDVIIRWLTKVSVEQFFDIVSKTMTVRPDMWEERRRFWTPYIQHLSAAWVAFGSDGAWLAEQSAKRSGDSSFAMFGRLASGQGRTKEHAALIMQIGDLTIVEWSHNGRWNIWRRTDRDHPKLFKHNDRRSPDYEPHDLMNAPSSGPHLGQWQWKVRDIIRAETGVRA